MGITEKRLADKRFKRTEEAILRVFFKEKNCISVGEIASRLGVARSTIYEHHRATWEILPDYEKYILRKYRRMVRKMMGLEEFEIRGLYFRMLYFVVTNREVFEILIKSGDDRVFRLMVMDGRMDLLRAMGLPKNSETLFLVYTSEVARLIYEWCKSGFKKKDAKVLGEIMYLTETARERLKVLLD